MKKFSKYILILIVLLGVFSPVVTTYAESPDDPGTCVTPSTNMFGNPSTITTFTKRKDCKEPSKFSANSAGVSGASAVTTQVQKEAEIKAKAEEQRKIDAAPSTLKPYELLAPLPCEPNTSGCVEVNGHYEQKTIDTTKGLGSYLNIIIKVFIGLCAVLAVVMIVMGGIEYMTSELLSSKEAGRERITNALFGLIIALGSYALLNTINPDLLKTDIKIDKTVIVYQEDIPQAPVNNKYVSDNLPYTVGENWELRAGPEKSAAELAALGASVSKDTTVCLTVGQPHCTSTAALNLSIISKIHSECPTCTIIITGGTEFWLHKIGTSHKPGSHTVDLRSKDNPELSKYITGGVTPAPGWYVKNDVSYLFEGDHWHVK